MKIRTIIPKAFFLIFLLSITQNEIQAQEIENQFQTRTELELTYKPIKKLKLSFIPQLRMDENFSLDKYLFEGAAEYKALKYLDFEAAYRFVVNPRDTKDTEYANRFAIGATVKKEFGRFEPAFRLQYTNDADDGGSAENFLRYKAKLKYDIAKCKITPYVAAEAFQQLDGSGLYKMRYSTGLDYKLFKNNYLGLSYKLDYYNKEYKNRHIVSLGYKFKF